MLVVWAGGGESFCLLPLGPREGWYLVHFPNHQMPPLHMPTNPILSLQCIPLVNPTDARTHTHTHTHTHTGIMYTAKGTVHRSFIMSFLGMSFSSLIERYLYLVPFSDISVHVCIYTVYCVYTRVSNTQCIHYVDTRMY